MDDVLNCVRFHLQGRTDNEWINRICSDSSYVGPLQLIIGDDAFGAQEKVPATLFLFRIIEAFGERWDSEFALSIDEWCLGLVREKKEYLVRDPVLMNAIGKLYGCLVLRRYQMDEQFSNFDERVSKLLFSDDVLLHAMGLHLFGSVTDEFCESSDVKRARNEYFTKALPNCVSASMQTIGKLQQKQMGAVSPEQEELLANEALGLLTKTLSMETTNSVKGATGDEISLFTVDIPISCRHEFSDPQLETLLMSFYSKFGASVKHQCLEALYRIISIQRNALVTEEVATMFSSCVDAMNMVLASENVEETHLVAVTAYKLGLCLTDTDGELLNSARGAPLLYRTMAALSEKIVVYQQLIESPQTVIYLVKFWACLVKVLPNIKDIETKTFMGEFIESLIPTWYHITEQAFLSDFEGMSAFFTRNEEGLFSEFKLFAEMMELDLEKHMSALESEAKQLMDQYQKSYSFDLEVRLLIVVDILTHILSIEQKERPQQGHLTRIQTKAHAFFALLNILSGTDGLLSRSNSEGVLLEQKLLSFVKCVRWFVDWDSPFRQEAKCLRDLTKMEFKDTLTWILGRVVHSTMSFRNNSAVLLDGLSVIRTVFVNKNIYRYQSDEKLIRFAQSEELLEISVDRECRRKFLDIAVKFLVQGQHKQELQALLDRLSRQFERQMQTYNEPEFVSLMDDLSIVFGVPISRDEYHPIFHWFFDTRMKEISTRIVAIANHPMSFEAFLNTWRNFIHGKDERIEVGPFSPDGIVLFKATAEIVHLFFEQVKSHRDLGFECLGSMFDEVVLILQVILSAHYVRYGVFQLYNDPVCDNMIRELFTFFDDMGYEQIGGFPEWAKNLCGLLHVLAKKFFATLVQLNVVETVLDITFFLMYLPTCDLESPCQEVLRIMLQSICAQDVQVNVATIDKFILKMFEVVLNRPEQEIQHISYNLRGLLKLDFAYLSDVQTQLSSELPQDLAEGINSQLGRITNDHVATFGSDPQGDLESKSQIQFAWILREINQIARRVPSFIRLLQ